jgi:hypothetical protein
MPFSLRSNDSRPLPNRLATVQYPTESSWHGIRNDSRV